MHHKHFWHCGRAWRAMDNRIGGHMKGCQGLPKGTVPFMNRLERTLIGSNICHDSRLITVSIMFTLWSNICMVCSNSFGRWGATYPVRQSRLHCLRTEPTTTTTTVPYAVLTLCCQTIEVTPPWHRLHTWSASEPRTIIRHTQEMPTWVYAQDQQVLKP